MLGRVLPVGRHVAAAVGVLSTTFLGGCGWLENQYTNDPAIAEGNDRRSVQTPGEGPTFDLWRACIPAERDPNGACPRGSTLHQINNFITNGQNFQAALLRNRLQDYLIMRSDQMCEKHRSGVLSTQAVTNFGMSTVTTGLTATAALVVAPATNILAALGAMTTGTRSAFNADIYQKYVAPAIVKKTTDLRNTKLLQIGRRQFTQSSDASKPPQLTSIEIYTPEAAVGDVEVYNQFCSFAWGIATLGDSDAKFEDSATGIQRRMELLRKQQIANDEQMKKLGGENSTAARRYKDINEDISRQIMVLQQQLLTAPTAADPKPASAKPADN